MFILKKLKHSQTLSVIENNEEIDQIHYENIDQLCEILKTYYSKELLTTEDEEWVYEYTKKLFYGQNDRYL